MSDSRGRTLVVHELPPLRWKSASAKTLKGGARLTSQGVRDLNGPEMNGASYNGRREGHKHLPDSPVVARLEEREVERTAGDQPIRVPRVIKVYYCLFCEAELYTSEDV